MKNTKHSNPALARKVAEFVQVLKGYGLTIYHSWKIKTANHKIQSCKLGGHTVILDIDNKWMEKHGLTISLIDEVIAELKNGFNAY